MLSYEWILTHEKREESTNIWRERERESKLKRVLWIVNCDCDQVVHILHEDVVEASVKVEICSTVSYGELKRDDGGWQKREREQKSEWEQRKKQKMRTNNINYRM